MEAEIVELDSKHPDQSVLDRTAHLLKKGGLVAFPTDTVYGLGAAVFDGQAVAKIFEVKRRPKGKPIAVLLSSSDQLGVVAEKIPEVSYRLMDKFWPGSLSLVVPCSSRVPSIVTGGRNTVAVRISDNQVALSLTSLAGPLATTSANLTGNPSPKDAGQVKRDLGEEIDLIIDGGPTQFGKVSTVLDLTTSTPQIVRRGVVTEAELHKVLGTSFSPS